MPVETDETTEQQQLQQPPNAPAEDGSENVSDVPATDTDGDEIPNATINGSISTSFLSNNELTSGLKRPLLNEAIGNEEIKKLKTTKNNGKEQLEGNTSLYKKNITKTNFNEHSYVYKKISEDKSNRDTFVNHSIEANNVNADQKPKINSPKKKTICLNNENKSFIKNNANIKRVPIFSQVIQSIPTKGNGSENNQNEHVQNRKNICEMTSPLNRSRSPSLLEKLVKIENRIENFDGENDNVFDVSMLAGSSGINNKCKSFNKSNAKNLENGNKNSVPNETKDVDDSDDDNVVVQEDVSSIDENDYNIIETDNNSESTVLEYDDDNVANDGDNDDDDDDDDDDNDDNDDDDNDNDDDDDDDEDNDDDENNEEDAAADDDNNDNGNDDDDGASTASLSNEEILNMLRMSKEIGKKNFPLLLKLFSSKKLTYEKFETFCTQIICSVMTENYNIGNYRKHLQKMSDRVKCWRTKFQILQLQLRELDSIVKTHNTELKKNGLARPHIITRTVGLQTNADIFSRSPKKPSTSDSVDITGDDDDVALVSENIKPNSKPSTSFYHQTPTLRKILPLPSVSKQTPVLLAKAVPPAIPLNPINSNDNGTIDLTEGDDVNIASSRLSLEKSPLKIIQRAAVNRNISPGPSSTQLTRNLTTQISPKNVTYIEVPKMQLPNSNYVMRTTTSTVTRSNLPISNINIQKTNVRPFIFKHGQLMPIQLSPVAPRQLQPVTSGTVTYSTRQIPTTQLAPLQPVPPAIPIALTTHPAPLPGIPNQRSLPTWKKLPPAPKVSLTNSPEPQNSKALVLSWNLALTRMTADITGYQIYAYHETIKESPRSDLWKKIGEVNALPLPMACSLTQFVSGERYHFAVRAVDIYTRVGPFSLPQSMLTFNSF